jgi:hypothetical protein
MKEKTNKSFFDNIYQKCRSYVRKKKILKWEQNGGQIPVPHEVKQIVIESYQKKFNISILIETGTYLGDMVNSQLNNFETIYSVELSNDLWKRAIKRFNRFKKIKLLQGDSGVVLHDLVPRINERAIFWLDGHYSAGITAKGEKDCPIFEELGAIFKSKINHILLIDDARLFIGEHDYPTIEVLTNYILSNFPQSNIEINNDIICVELIS